MKIIYVADLHYHRVLEYERSSDYQVRQDLNEFDSEDLARDAIKERIKVEISYLQKKLTDIWTIKV